RDAGTRGPVTAPHPAGARRPESGVPDVPAPPPSQGGEGGRGDAEGARAEPGPGGDVRPAAAAAGPVPPGRVLVRARRGAQRVERDRARDPAERPRGPREGRRDGVPRPARGRRDDPPGIRAAGERYVRPASPGRPARRDDGRRRVDRRPVPAGAREGRRAGAREDGRGDRGEQGRGDEDVRQREARREIRRSAPQAPPEDLTLTPRGPGSGRRSGSARSIRARAAPGASSRTGGAAGRPRRLARTVPGTGFRPQGTLLRTTTVCRGSRTGLRRSGSTSRAGTSGSRRSGTALDVGCSGGSGCTTPRGCRGRSGRTCSPAPVGRCTSGGHRASSSSA